jgi:hypothetical protein
VRADPLDRSEIPVAVVLAVHDRDAVARCLIALLPALPDDVPLLAAGAAGGRGVARGPSGWSGGRRRVAD